MDRLRESRHDHADDVKLDRFYRFMNIDLSNVPEEVTLKGLRKPVLTWQFYGAFCILEDMQYYPTKFLWDQVGLGKVRDISRVFS